MTTAKLDSGCNAVNAVNADSMQVQEHESRIDDEVQHDNAKPHVHVDAMYSTEYNKCHGRQRWQALKSNNG